MATDDLGQALAVGALQGGVEPGEQVVEAHLGAAGLLGGEPLGDPMRRVAQKGRARGGQIGQLAFEVGDRLKSGMGGRIALPGIGKTCGRETLPAGLEIGPLGDGIGDPVSERVQPGCVVTHLQLASVDALVGDGPVQKCLKLLCPGRPRCLELGETIRLLSADDLERDSRLRRGVEPIGMLHERSDGPLQRLRTGPPLPHLGGRLGIERDHEGPPIVAHHLGEQLALIGLQGLGEVAVAVEGVLAQHPIAPAVDGRDRGLVHPLGGQLQLACAGRPVIGQVFGAQVVQRILARGAYANAVRLGAEGGRGLGKTQADAVAQLARGGIGEGDDQDLGRGEGAGSCIRCVVRYAVTEHQTDIECRDGEGLAGAGTGLDQTAAAERKAQRIECIRSGGSGFSPTGFRVDIRLIGRRSRCCSAICGTHAAAPVACAAADRARVFSLPACIAA